jgi:hypothetical protein
MTFNTHNALIALLIMLVIFGSLSLLGQFICWIEELVTGRKAATWLVLSLVTLTASVVSLAGLGAFS